MSVSGPGNVAGLRCINCNVEHLFSFPAYRCECGGNLEVTYDLPAVAATFERPDSGTLARRGHFAYDALLPLNGPGERHFSLMVGASQLVPRHDLAAECGLGELYFKDDSRLPSASFKDRASSVLLAMAAERNITTVCTASTGNAGCSMACLCADAGLDAYVFVPATAPRAKIAQLLFYGAHVVRVAGTYDDAFDLCWELSEQVGWLNRSTGWNPFTKEGKKTVSFEIAQQLAWQAPDVVFVSVGDGNIIAGVHKGFKELAAIGVIEKVPAIVAVQSNRSNAIALAVERVANGTPPVASVEPVGSTTIADSISVDLPRDGVAAVKAVVESGGDAIQVSDDEILQAIVTLARRTGIFAEPAAATAYAGIRHWVARHPEARNMRGVCLITGNGLKDVDAAAGLLGTALEVPPDLAQAARLLGV
jgi:threonine synthase